MEDFDLSQLPPEVIQQLIELGALGDQSGLLNEQLATSEALRYGPGPEGRDSGRVYTAANPLEHLGSALQQYNAMKESKSIRKKQDDILRQQTEARRIYADLLRAKSGLPPLREPKEEDKWL